MKRALVLVAVFFLTLCSCYPKTLLKTDDIDIKTTGIWITYNELNNMLTSSVGFGKEVDLAVQKCKDMYIDNVYIHVRSHCDSIFLSDYFPLTKTAKEKDFDIFSVLIDAFHKEGIAVHAWINPYRVQTTSSEIENIDYDSPAYKWLKDEEPLNDSNVCILNGIYLNPAKPEVQELVLNGVREIIEKYEVDGIHFDDYFYPTADEAFDSGSYAEYCNSTEKPLTLADWRRANVNTLISSCYNTIKYKNQNISFTVSPSASIDKNYNQAFADVREWVADGYIDAIIPQLYFGFEHPQSEYCFEELVKLWKDIASLNENVDLYLGLAAYKIGTSNISDGDEWQRDEEIIAKQAEICYKEEKIDGYVLFSYSYVFSEQQANINQIASLKEEIEKHRIFKEG